MSTNILDKSLSETLGHSDLEKLTVDISESILDSAMENGVLKDIPILGSLIGLIKTTSSVKNHLFLKKVIHFLFGLKDIPSQSRDRMISKIEKDTKYKIKVGEQLNYFLDRCNDHLYAQYLAQFFKAFIEEKITYDDFLRGGNIILNIFLDDLEQFLKDKDRLDFYDASPEESPSEDDFPLINVGILCFGSNPINVVDEYDHEINQAYKVEGGETIIWTTSIGKKLKEHLFIENSDL